MPTHTKRWAALAKTSFAPAIPSHANLRVVYTAASLPAKVVYWAARGRALSDAHKLIGAERAYDDAYRRSRERKMIEDMASKSHKDKVREFNEKLSKLSEHHDIPKVGPG